MIQAMTISFREELLAGVHALTTDTLKIALYRPESNVSTATAAYTPQQEAAGGEYVAGGQEVTNATVLTVAGETRLLADPVAWTQIDGSVRYALLYNNDKQQRSVALFDLFSTVTPGNQPLRLRFEPFLLVLR